MPNDDVKIKEPEVNSIVSQYAPVQFTPPLKLELFKNEPVTVIESKSWFIPTVVIIG